MLDPEYVKYLKDLVYRDNVSFEKEEQDWDLYHTSSWTIDLFL